MDRTTRLMQRSRQLAGARRGEQDSALNGEAKIFRKDAGWRMTNSDYSSYLSNEKSFNKSVGEAQGELDTARGKLDAASAQNAEYESALSGVNISNTSLDSSWKSYQKSFVPVRVVNKDKIEGTYYLPKDVVSNMDKDSFNKKGSYTGNWVDNGKNYNVDVRLNGGARGQELHDALRSGVSSIKADFYEQNASAVRSARSEENTARNQLSSAKSQVSANYSNLSAEGDILAAEGSSLSEVKGNRKQQKNKIASTEGTALRGRRSVLGVKQ